jgi:hypothetical protein
VTALAHRVNDVSFESRMCGGVFASAVAVAAIARIAATAGAMTLGLNR